MKVNNFHFNNRQMCNVQYTTEKWQEVGTNHTQDDVKQRVKWRLRYTLAHIRNSSTTVFNPGTMAKGQFSESTQVFH